MTSLARKIRVMIVDDSAFNRRMLTEMLSRHPEIDVVGTAYDGQVAIKRMGELKPDVITLDLEMPVLDGFATLRWVMANRPLPVIVVSSQASDRNVFKALDLGAVDFIAKPSPKASMELREIERDLVDKVLASMGARLGRRVAVDPPAPPPIPAPPPVPVEGDADLVLIGSSTGGPTIVQQILKSVPENVATSFVVAQHMPPVFTNLFADRLNRSCAITVKEASDGNVVESGYAYIAPGGMQTRVAMQKGRPVLRVSPRADNDRFAPSINTLFSSAAEAGGLNLVGVILTGMGGDGREGLANVKKAGGTALVESPDTATIRTMPEEMVRAGLADFVGDADALVLEVLRRCRSGKSKRRHAPSEE